MESRTFEIIQIDWQESSLQVKDAFNNPDKVLPAHIGGGLYQIYGHSPIYGPDVLLYIGITKDFNIRWDQHLRFMLSRGLNLRFVFGKVSPDIKTDIAESILIATHKPCYNKQFLHQIKHENSEGGVIFNLVHNHGNRGALMLECTDYWWKN